MAAERASSPEGPGSVSGAPNLPAGFTEAFESRYVDTGDITMHAVFGGTGPPLLMIHGGADTYIKPKMARSLFDLAREPKEFWLVKGAKHNQALQVAGEEYRRRVLEFLQAHLAEPFQVRVSPAAPVAGPKAHRLRVET